MDVEPADVESLQRRRRLHGSVAAAEEKQLVDMDRQGWRIVLELTVPAGDQLHRPAVVPGFLQNLPGDRGGRRVPRIGPATRQRPPAVTLLAHQQHPFVIVEDHTAYVDLRRGIAAITAELDSELVSRPAAERREQL